MKMTVENATVDFWRLARRAASPGVAAAALFRSAEDNTCYEAVGRTAMAPSFVCPPIPRVWHHGKASQRQQADRHEV